MELRKSWWSSGEVSRKESRSRCRILGISHIASDGSTATIAGSTQVCTSNHETRKNEANINDRFREGSAAPERRRKIEFAMTKRGWEEAAANPKKKRKKRRNCSIAFMKSAVFRARSSIDNHVLL
jgi:hypothetical protein